MDYTEDMLVKDLQAIQEVVDALNDLIVLVSKGDVKVRLKVVKDSEDRQQVKLYMED